MERKDKIVELRGLILRTTKSIDKLKLERGGRAEQVQEVQGLIEAHTNIVRHAELELHKLELEELKQK